LAYLHIDVPPLSHFNSKGGW